MPTLHAHKSKGKFVLRSGHLIVARQPNSFGQDKTTWYIIFFVEDFSQWMECLYCVRLRSIFLSFSEIYAENTTRTERGRILPHRFLHRGARSGQGAKMRNISVDSFKRLPSTEETWTCSVCQRQACMTNEAVNDNIWNEITTCSICSCCVGWEWKENSFFCRMTETSVVIIYEARENRYFL